MSINTAHAARSTSFGPSLPGIAHLLQSPNPEKRTISDLNLDHSIIPPSPSTRFILQPRPQPPLPTPLPSFSDVLSATIPDYIRYSSPLISRDASESYDDDDNGSEEEQEAEYEVPRQEKQWRPSVMRHRTRAKPEQMVKLMELWKEVGHIMHQAARF